MNEFTKDTIISIFTDELEDAKHSMITVTINSTLTNILSAVIKPMKHLIIMMVETISAL